MAEDDSESALEVRAAGRIIHPSPDEIEQIRAAVDIVTEIFGSLIHVATDDRVIEELRRGSNSELGGLTPLDLRDLSKELSDTLSALSREILCTDTLRMVAIDLDRHLHRARKFLAVRSEHSKFCPVDQAAPDAIAETLLAGISDAKGSFSQLLGLLEDIASQSSEDHSGH